MLSDFSNFVVIFGGISTLLYFARRKIFSFLLQKGMKYHYKYSKTRPFHYKIVELFTATTISFYLGWFEIYSIFQGIIRVLKGSTNCDGYKTIYYLENWTLYEQKLMISPIDRCYVKPYEGFHREHSDLLPIRVIPEDLLLKSVKLCYDRELR
jgi:hypothetical protein